MKNILIKSLLAFAVLCVASGCIEETFPVGAVQTQEQVSKNESAIKAMLNSIPASMMTSNVAGFGSRYNDHTDFGIGGIFLRTENMLEDLATQSQNPYANRFYVWGLCEAMGSRYIWCNYFWTVYYSWIKTCNDIIGLVDPATSDPAMQLYLGQAHAFRAYFYLDMARLYEPKDNDYLPVTDPIRELTVPLITEKTTEAQAMNNPRLPRKEMYDFILADLTKAASLLKGKAVDYTMPGEMVVNGLFARTYLELGASAEPDPAAYQKALDYAQKVIDGSGKTPLTQEEWEDPANGFNNGAANNSWIWGLTSSSENQINILTYSAHISSESQWGYAPMSHVGISKKLYDMIPDADFRKHSWLDPKFLEYYDYKLAGTPDEQKAFLEGDKDLQIEAAFPYQAIKFRPAEGNTSDFTIGNVTDLCMMRIEEMHFIKAEALAQLGRLSDAQTTLNKLVNTRYVNAEEPYDCSSMTTSLKLFLEEMLLQKRIEFWGEGILFYDYKRLDHGIERAYEGSNHAPVFALNCKGRSPQWNLVITRGEFQANSGITDETNNPDPTFFVKPTEF